MLVTIMSLRCFQCLSALHHDQSSKADQSTLAKADQSKSLAVTSNLLHCSGLQSESLGLLDLLVLLKARRFVGFVSSTFSWMVQVGH